METRTLFVVGDHDITMSETSCMNMGFSIAQLLSCKFGGNHE
jgi:hypothetical protein